jgi:GNAT superfamily N-acetyltransferase
VKQVGPNKFVGDDPYFCQIAAEIAYESQRRRFNECLITKTLSPVDRFFSLLKERTKRPKRYGFLVGHNYFRFGEHTLISVQKTKNLSGVPDCNMFMCQLESIYVVDVARGQGCGTECIKMLSEIAEESGCVIELFCNPFGWSCDGKNMYAMESFEQLWNVVFDEKWDVVYDRDFQKELTKFFYERSGFVNICLYDQWVYERDKSEDLPFEQQFAYLPFSLKPEYRKQLDGRLKKEACEFCNRK